MHHGLPRCLLLLLLTTLSLAPLTAGEDDEPILLMQSASGTYDVDGEGLLIIEDIEGTLSIRSSTDTTLRFEGRGLSSQRALQEVALWRSGSRTLLLGPGATVDEAGTLVDMVVPASLDVEVFLNGGRVLVSAIEGDLLVEAEESKVQARGLRGGAEFLLTGGVLRVDGVKGEFSFKGTDVNAEVEHLYAEAVLELTRGRTMIDGSDAGVQIEGDQTELEINDVKGSVRVVAEGGSVNSSGCLGGGDLSLEGATLLLAQSKGDFAVRTDTVAEFTLNEGALDVLAYGAPIRGMRVGGPLTIESSNASIELHQIAGSIEIRGSDLNVKIADSTGSVGVHTVSSQIAIDRTKSPVLVENDYGDIRTGETEATLNITSSGGNVHIGDHQGGLELRANGPEVRVEWSKFTKQDPMMLHNESGDVHVAIPASGRCFLQLKAPFGGIDGDLAGIIIAEDGHSAAGEYTGGRGKAPQVKKPRIKVTAGGGNIYLSTAETKD